MNFSKEEVRDLIKAWIAISLAVSIAIVGLDAVRTLGFAVLIRAFVVYALTVGVAFLSHEILGHKFLAQRRGLFAEFKADDLFLMLAVFLSFTGFVFVAPGAVVISGVTRIDTYGKIAAGGPLVNIVLASIFSILARSGFELYLPLYAGQGIDLITTSYQINAWLALFNLLPLGVLDGAKVLAWNKGVWVALAGASALLFLGII
ncbi:MAG TPA: peptidase M50 [candidate division WWE3 bacterium]|uniref:Peptidase M50 n=1 Tax=candidate division WWE3 bacterium TaxID=2053526 RepID=A0A7C1T5Y0_UNCKA|nr:peptidase M50 [candidate division WWE3 bacterium]